MATVFAVHVALIAFLLQQSVKVEPMIEAAPVAAFALSAERPAAAKPPPPAIPAKVADTFKPIAEFSIPTETESDAPAGASGLCSTLAVVRDGLMADAVATAAILGAPPEMRSIADAIAIWNEGWNPVVLAQAAPLAAVRASIERSLAAVPDPCLDEPMAGPRMIQIPDATGTRTIFLVLGSGTWTWRAVLAPPDLPLSDSAVAGPAPSAGGP